MFRLPSAHVSEIVHHLPTVIFKGLCLLFLVGMLVTSMGSSASYAMGLPDSPDGWNGAPPVLIEPLNGSTPTFTPTFRWKSVTGATKYTLQYTTSPNCEYGTAGWDATVSLPNTLFTPTTSFPNDKNICWHVRSESGNEVSQYSPIWVFQKQWYIQAIPLTPVNLYAHEKGPFFSWTPVPGAAYYFIEICSQNSFPCPGKGFSANAVNPFYTISLINQNISNWYWRVTPYDGSNNMGKPSDGNPHPVVTQFTMQADSLAPAVYYPFYYYQPNNFPPPDKDVSMYPNEDRTIGDPLFMWHRVFTLAGQEAERYEVQVDHMREPGYQLFSVSSDELDWTAVTENLSVTPTGVNDFQPDKNIVYYWRVRAYYGSAPGDWSEIWAARFDPAKRLAAQSTAVAIRPVDNSEIVELMPLFEWMPVSGANYYKIQISQDPDFKTNMFEDRSTDPVYSPTDNWGSRTLGNLNYGTYFWRVAGFTGTDVAIGDWSTTRRFQLASQSQFRDTRGLGQPVNRLEIGSDDVEVSKGGYDLTQLTAAQDKDFWYFGFNAEPGPDTDYVLYLDTDRADTPATDPRSDILGYQVSTAGIHRPEFAIYVKKIGNRFLPIDSRVYRWSGQTWNFVTNLGTVGGVSGDVMGDLYSVATYSGSTYTVGKYGDWLSWQDGEWNSIQGLTQYDLHFTKYTDNQWWQIGEHGTVILLGAEKNPQNTGTTNTLYGMSDILTLQNSQKVGWIVGANGTLLKWNGSNWSSDGNPDTLNPKHALYGVAAIVSPSDGNKPRGFAVGENGYAIEYDTVSGKWIVSDSKTNNNLYAIDHVAQVVGADTVHHFWAVGDHGTIIYRTDLTNWAVQTSPTTNTLRGIDMLSATNGWAVGDKGTILHWNGTNWSVVSSGTGEQLNSVAMLNANDGIIVGENGISLHWNGSSWAEAGEPVDGFVEIKVPNSAIGMAEDTNAMSLALFSVDLTTKQVQDALPNPSGSLSTLDRFTDVSERLYTSFPPSDAGGDPTQFSFVPPFFFEYPVHAPWVGYHLQVSKDQRFTSVLRDYIFTFNVPYISLPLYAEHTKVQDIQGDNTYFWRVRPEYCVANNCRTGGAFSQPISFERKGVIPMNLEVSTLSATPTFTWDMVEGARGYDLEVYRDPNFGSLVLRATTTQTTYTHSQPLPTDTYYWRVRAKRDGGVDNDWSHLLTFGATYVYLPFLGK